LGCIIDIICWLVCANERVVAVDFDVWLP
jgi:hypothetical protein